MNDWIPIDKDKKHIAKERAKAKTLRKTQWWQNKLNEGTCHYCGKRFPRDELTMDHIVPVSRGGKSTKANVVPCCKECNNTKEHLTPVEILLRNNTSK
ncbi:MAG TPA: HNH endonuclease [Candidatus Marinimicrobia bacterium]|mgnify:CR=1 FL=1|nr:HNH endonuclease [Candidatus Neomarinimicrobiota bacterium]